MSQPEATSPSAAQHAASMTRYVHDGCARADQLNHRGPLRLDTQGRLHPDILDAYREHGFYVFEGVVSADEIAELRSDIDFLLEHAPTGQGSDRDSQGRPAFGQDFAINPYVFIKPLSDPWGGTRILGGRHPTQMTQPTPEQAAPDEVVHILTGMCQTMPSGLRLYGHPDLLAIAASLNGEDFVPYNDAIFVKLPGLGGSVSWHQDGVTHWDNPDWHDQIHGFNFQVQLYECTARNALWVVPGSHKLGRIDIKALIADNNDDEQLPDAIPLLCAPGDVTIVNRQVLHASFANTSPDTRVSLTFGFHRRSSVLGAHGALGQAEEVVYDEERIFQRSRLIQVAINARRAYHPQEEAFSYQPFAGQEARYPFDRACYDNFVRDYNLLDLSI